MKNEVTDAGYGQIIAYLKGKGVNDETLQAEMADHLVIITELHMESGKDFDAAFDKAKTEVAQKDLLEINDHAGSFRGYPRFLNKHFLIIFGLISLLIFLVGLYMRYNHLPHRRIVILTGRALFGYVFLPLLLLHNLTEYANKTKQVLGFVAAFALFQTISGYLLHWRFRLIFLIVGIGSGLLWLLLFKIVPRLKRK